MGVAVRSYELYSPCLYEGGTYQWDNGCIYLPGIDVREKHSSRWFAHLRL